MSEPWLMCRATLRRYQKIWRTSHNLDATPTSLSFDISINSYNRFLIIRLIKLSTAIIHTHRLIYYPVIQQPCGSRVKNMSTPNPLPDIPRSEWIERA